MSSIPEEQRKAMFANMQKVDVGITSSQIGIPNQIPIFEAKEEDTINEFAESNFAKFEMGEKKILENDKLSDSEKTKKFNQLAEEEQAIAHLSKTVQTVQSPNTSGHEKFMALDKFLKDKKYSDALPDSIRKKLELKREMLKKQGFSKNSSNDEHKHDSEELIDGHEIDVEVKIVDG